MHSRQVKKIETAPSYQSRQTQIETEKQLLYSETAALKQLLSSFMAD
ncbi:single-stranded-DNA-specific exonuclease C-terminal domain-containing protein [Secundilactobacillus collinoides]